MAIIYDLATGTVISENRGETPVNEYFGAEHVSPALQPANETFDADQDDPMNAYMVLLQRLLKDL